MFKIQTFNIDELDTQLVLIQISYNYFKFAEKFNTFFHDYMTTTYERHTHSYYLKEKLQVKNK